jgi:uncharacterized protein YndB with AHSA1/START domain
MATIKLEKYIAASPSEVYQYFTNSTALRDWMCDIATTDPRQGGHIYLSWTDGYYMSGEFIKLMPEKLVSFTWFGKGEPRNTTVIISMKPQKRGTLVKITHRGTGKGEKWAGIATTFEKEWQTALTNLASVLEEGPDLRITRRPMIGITTGEFNAGIASKMGIPVDYGLYVSGVLDGMGAQKAGLQDKDVIVSVDGVGLATPGIFASMIGKKHAGDPVEIVFYRGSEKKEVRMILSGRPIPTVPGTIKQMKDQQEVAYRQLEGEIEALLRDVSDEASARKPSPDEWSANEILAHLIHSEVGWQNVMSEIIVGYEGAYDGFGGNLQAHIDGTVAIYPTKTELFLQLKKHNAETLQMIAHIPESFVTHKGKFWKLVFLMDQNPYHLQEHLGQIQKAINTARRN